jgi:CRP-like cAMP-binding protein
MQKAERRREVDNSIEILASDLLTEPSSVDVDTAARPEPTSGVLGQTIRASCTVCPAYQLSLCGEIIQKFGSADSAGAATALTSTTHRVPARHTIFHHKEWSEHVPFICSGWAAMSITLADGRRQTLSFLLPGDVVSAACLFEPMSGRTVEAITEVEYRKFKRSELKGILLKNLDLMDRVFKIWSEERIQSDQMALDLGRRTADERIARLIVNIADRLAKRGMRNGGSMEFPLRQRHIADATGLTPVHVSKVVGEFQRAGLFEIRGRALTIFNEMELRRAAEWR